MKSKMPSSPLPVSPPFFWQKNCSAPDLNTLRSVVEQELSLREADPALLKKETSFSLEEPFPGLDGCYETTLEGADFHFFFKSSSAKRLYVFLDGARTRDGGTRLADLPHYLSWSWYPLVEANLISLEDPMYYAYPGLKLGWFFGTGEQDYRRLLAQLIHRLAEQLGIAQRDIVLYGRSGGGTAAFATASFLPGCTAVAVNPQLDITRHVFYQNFREETGLDLLQPQFDRRRDVIGSMKEDRSSHYLYLGNLLSPNDMRNHAAPLCAAFEIREVCYGLTQKDQLSLWLYYAKGATTPHAAFETRAIFPLIDQVVQHLAHGDPIPPELVGCINSSWNEDHAQQRKVKERLEGQKGKLESRLTVTQEELKQANSTIQKLEQKLNAIESSFLYRCLKPLRRFIKKIRSLFSGSATKK